MTFIALSLFSYLVGSVNGAQFLHHTFRGRYEHHITSIGTLNAGAQNVFMTIGKASGLIVFLIDFLKGILVIVVGRLVGLEGAMLVLLGVFAIAGHNWPIFYHFRGGRGFAALIGTFYGFNPLIGIAASLISMPFAFARLAGISPFVFLVVGAIAFYTQFGLGIILAYVVTAMVLFAKRVYVGWGPLKESNNKVIILKNLLIYDRTTNNPPSLKKLFL